MEDLGDECSGSIGVPSRGVVEGACGQDRRGADARVFTAGVRCGVVLSVTAESPVYMGSGSYGALSCHLTGPGVLWCPLGGTQGPMRERCPVRTYHRLVSLRA